MRWMVVGLGLAGGCGTSMPTCESTQEQVDVDTPIDQGKDVQPWTLRGWQDAVQGPFDLDVELPDGTTVVAALTIDLADVAEFTDARGGRTNPLSTSHAFLAIDCRDSLAADVTAVLSAPGLPDLTFAATGSTTDAASISTEGPVDTDAARTWVGDGTDEAASLDRVVAAGREITLRVEVGMYEMTGAGIAIVAWEGDTLSTADWLVRAGTLADGGQ